MNKTFSYSKKLTIQKRIFNLEGEKANSLENLRKKSGKGHHGDTITEASA